MEKPRKHNKEFSWLLYWFSAFQVLGEVFLTELPLLRIFFIFQINREQLSINEKLLWESSIWVADSRVLSYDIYFNKGWLHLVSFNVDVNWYLSIISITVLQNQMLFVYDDGTLLIFQLEIESGICLINKLLGHTFIVSWNLHRFLNWWDSLHIYKFPRRCRLLFLFSL